MYKHQISQIDAIIKKGKFKDNWNSLADYEVPIWYRNAKFGIFCHFGPYTVPEFGHDWYVHGMYTKDDFINKYHVETYGPLKDFGYKHLIKCFTAERFKASTWLDVIEATGAKYFVPVAEHHDGFQMYSSDISVWNSKEKGPKIDFIKELESAAIERGINFGLSTHRAEHWFFMEPGLLHDTDVHESKFGDVYWPTKPKSDIGVDKKLTQLYLDDWLIRTKELIDKFKPRVLYFDFWIENPVFTNHLKKILAYYYNTMLDTYGDCGVVNYKHDAIPYGLAVRDVERGQFEQLQNDYWQGCTSTAHNSWIYTNTNDYKLPENICRTLVDIISKNGNLLLNIGPKADGTICAEELEILTNVGMWVQLNSEAIFRTRTYKVFGEGAHNVTEGDFNEGHLIDYDHRDFRFTCHANKTYVFIMNPYGHKTFKIRTMGLYKQQFKKNNQIKSITALGMFEIKTYNRLEAYLKVQFNEIIETRYPVVICIEVE